MNAKSEGMVMGVIRFKLEGLICKALVILASTMMVACSAVGQEEQEGPGVSTLYSVTIFFNSSLCPVFSVFDEKPGKKPEVTKDDQIEWVAKRLDGVASFPSDFRFAVVFDPLQQGGTHYKSTGSNKDRVGPKSLVSSSKLPMGVDYKYTVVKVNNSGVIDTNCPPLDPIIRVL